MKPSIVIQQGTQRLFFTEKKYRLHSGAPFSNV
jgi:hypothetical protein